MEGVLVLTEAIESRLLWEASRTPFWGKLDRLESSKDTRASSPKGFSAGCNSFDESSYGFPGDGWFVRRVWEEAIEEMEGLLGVRVVCSESIGSSEYSSEKTLGFADWPEGVWRCIESVSWLWNDWR